MTSSSAAANLAQNNDLSASESLLAAGQKPREIKVNQLIEPNLNLTYDYNPKDRTLTVQLKVPNSSGDERQVPFLAVTGDPVNNQALLTQARRSVIDLTNGELAGPIKVNAEGSGKFKVFEFKVSVGTDFVPGRNLGGIMDRVETQFDASRQEMYRERALKWTADGGARIDGKDAKQKDVVYSVSDEAGLGYLKYSDQRYNNQHPGAAIRGSETRNLENIMILRRGMRGDAGIDMPNGASPIAANDTLAPGNDRVNRHFEQAMKGTGGDKDAAAVAVEVIGKAQGFKPEQDISVIQGKNGFIVSQGQGDYALNLQVPAAKPGDFDRVATQMAQQPQQQIAMQPDQPQQERKGLSMA